MKIDKYILLLLLIITPFGGCSSAGDDDDSGTIISNPKLESDNIFPDFELAIPETSLLGDSSSSSSLSALSTVSLTKGLSSLIIDSTEVPPIVEGAITTGAKLELDRIRDNMIIAGLVIAPVVNSITLTTEIQTLSTNTYTVFVDAASKWHIDIKYEDEFIYLYFKDQDQGDYRALYIVKTDDTGTPVKGIFVYVNPFSFDGADDEVRSMYVAFDTTDSTDNRLLMRLERAYLLGDSSAGIPFYSYHDFYQCNPQTLQCLTDHFESDKTDGTVAEDFQVRLGYEESTKIVCLAQLLEQDDRSYALVSDTYQYTGPDVPDPSGVTKGGCSLPSPAWSFNSADFISEAEAKGYYGDGTSRDSWDTITPDLIDSALDGTGY